MSRKKATPKIVVGVGASAGGLDAFKQLMSALPKDTGMAFLLVQHLDPTHKSLLSELLRPCTEMTVLDADQGVELVANTVYIIRPDTALAVRNGKIELSQPTLHRGVRLPVDHLFRSLAHEYGSRAVGIVLSGAGSDGSGGLRDIKAAGGLVIAQDPAASGQAGMPQSAIATGAVDLVLEIEEIPEALTRFAAMPPQGRLEDEGEDIAERRSGAAKLREQDVTRLAAILDAQASFDLRVYKAATIERRVLRRMTLSGFEDVEAYFEHLRSDDSEQQTLVRDLLISVTDFFRDPEAYAALRQMVIHPLVAQASPGDTLRVWVPGCATGEEAYSIGIELLDALEEQNKRTKIQIFATDVDQDALSFARVGIYPPSITEHISEQRLQAYFKPLDGKGYQVRPALRDVVSFASHDLTKDPPFSRMHLVSCRNVLIYLTSEAQKHVLKILHFALEPEGHLFLSTSETTGSQQSLFSVISKKQRIYRKRGNSRPITVTRSRKQQGADRHGAGLGTMREPPTRPAVTAHDLARRMVIEAFAPPTLVVSADDTVLFAHGDLEPFIRMPQGDNPRFELGAVLRPEIATRARGALYKCRRSNEVVTAISSPDSGARRVRIQANPAPALGEDVVIISFHHVDEEEEKLPLERPESPEQDAVIDQLEKELTATREDLRNTVEELETSNEELRSSNEESMSMNEELQSANEELEATTEELRSLNEELTTVNSQLREKVEQLEQTHDDLNNFFASTKIATIFLDDRLCIKRFTPAARELLEIDHADAGRFIGGIARELLQNDLEQETRSVLEHLSPRSREIQTSKGRWITRCVLPYRTESQRIEGVVVTFVDITDLKSATERLALRERQQSMVARVGLSALRATDLQGFMDQVVRDVQQTLGTDCCKILELQPGGEKMLLRAGTGWQPNVVGRAYVSTGLDSQAGYTLQVSDPVIVEDLSQERRFSGPALLVDHEIVSGVSCIIRSGEHVYGVLGAHTRQPRRFSEEDASFLQAIATAVGSAINRHQGRRRLALEREVAQVLAETSNLSEALPRLVDCMMSELSASVGEIWDFEQEHQSLSRRLLRVVPPSEWDHVDEHLAKQSFAPGEGLVGRVYQNQRASWCSELGNPSLFTRRDAAKSLGLVSAFGLPIYGDDGVIGVITLFSSERLFADDVFLRSLESLGRSIGDFVKRTEFEQRARRLAAITESSHDAILSYLLDGTVTEWLPGAQRLFGYSTEEMIGQSIEKIVPDERKQQLWEINRRIQSGEIVEPFETTRICSDGRSVEVSVRSSPVKNREGRVIGISSTDRDITRQKETERKLLEADRHKDNFLAMLGHELRNPLAAICSATEVLKHTNGDTTKLGEIQNTLEQQSRHMAGLLDGLLDVSRIAQGKIRLRRQVIDLVAICRKVADDGSGRLNGRKLEIQSDFPSEPIWVEADPVRLTQIVDNLLSNAIKFTDDGGRIDVSLRREGENVMLVVRDTGVGIDSDLLPHVFETFRQSEQNLDRSQGGLGLGLSLVKSLVEAHGGRVEITSAGTGRGTEFVVWLPVTEQAAPEENLQGAAAIDHLKILIIEDTRAAAHMLQAVLESCGHEVWVAGRGQEGIELARELALDVVLCDIGLPDGMSGFEVAKALRSDRRTQGLPLVATTGYGRPEDKDQCEAAGFDAHLTKPVSVDTLHHVLSQVCQDKRNT